MIKVENLTKKFDDKTVLDGLHIDVKKGSVYGLVGPNGSGKTTIIKHIIGAYKQDSGIITIDGENPYENPLLKERIFYIPDDIFYYSYANTIEMKKFYQSIYPKFNEERFEKLKEAFTEIDIKTPIRKLSRGMQKQVVFWIGISCMADIIVLDEPVDGLDPVMRRKVWGLLLQDVAERNTTIMVSSHNLRELEDVCDYVGILHQGKLILERGLQDLQDNIVKVQTANNGVVPQGVDVLNISQNGSVYSYIVRGNRSDIKSKFEQTNPDFLDLLPLSLEEIFIYELGGMDYEIKNIII